MDVKRNPQMDAAKGEQWMLRMDDGGVAYFATLAEAERELRIMAEKTAEQEIVERIDTILPQLRDVFAQLKTMSDMWHVDGVDVAIKEAAGKGEDLADMPLAYWLSMGATFTALMEFLETPIAGIGQTPKEVMTRRNWRTYPVPKEALP